MKAYFYLFIIYYSYSQLFFCEIQDAVGSQLISYLALTNMSSIYHLVFLFIFSCTDYFESNEAKFWRQTHTSKSGMMEFDNSVQSNLL